MNDTKQALEAAVGLVGKATPGDWKVFTPDDYEEGGCSLPGLGVESETGRAVVWYADRPEQGIENDPDAEAIAAAVNLIRTHGPQLAQALEDARRYRWLRSHEWDYPIVKLGCGDYDHLNGGELDASIDAMAAGGDA